MAIYVDHQSNGQNAEANTQGNGTYANTTERKKTPEKLANPVHTVKPARRRPEPPGFNRQTNWWRPDYAASRHSNLTKSHPSIHPKKDRRRIVGDDILDISGYTRPTDRHLSSLPSLPTVHAKLILVKSIAVVSIRDRRSVS